MPVYQIPNKDIGVTKTVSGTTSANALVLLKNPASGEVVATTTADNSGDYSFTVSTSIPLQVSVPSSVDPQIQTTIDITSPALAYADYGDNHAGDPASIPGSVSDFPQTSGSVAWYYDGVPTVSVVDYTGFDKTGPGIGSGAEIEVEMAGVGDPYASYSSRVVLSELYGGVGKPLRRYTLKKVGDNYSSPYMRITGTVVFYYSGSVEQAISAGFTNAYSYDNSTYYKVERTSELIMITRQLGVVGVTGVEQLLGSDHSTWGQYDNDYRGGRCTASFPGEQDISEPSDDSSVDGATAIQDVKDALDNSSLYNGSQMEAYFAIIYGQGALGHTGNPASPFEGVPSNVLDGSALWAYNNGHISKQEVDLLKGYFGRKFLVEPLSNFLPITPFWNSYTAASVLLGAWNIIQGVAQTTIAQEYQSFSRQFNGLTINNMSKRIKPILDKITAVGGKDFNTLQTLDSSGRTVQWNFNSTSPTSTII